MSYGLPTEVLSGCQWTESSTLMDLHFETDLYIQANNDLYMWNQVNCTKNHYANVGTSSPYKQWSYSMVSCPHHLQKPAEKKGWVSSADQQVGEICSWVLGGVASSIRAQKNMQARMQDKVIKQVQIVMSAQRQASDAGININISPLISWKATALPRSCQIKMTQCYVSPWMTSLHRLHHKSYIFQKGMP